MASLSFRPVPANDIETAYAIEVAGFPEDEAATLDKLRTRQQVAPELFLGVYSGSEKADELVGYVCATLIATPELTEESMSSHDPAGSYVAIHSVCVSPAHLRQGIALSLLKEYVQRVKSSGKKGARLIAHEELRGLYEKAGFRWDGLSAVKHGARAWYAMSIDFSAPAAPVVLAAPPKEERRNPGVTLAEAGGAAAVREQQKNKWRLYCPREGCRSLILREDEARWVEFAEAPLELPALPQKIEEVKEAGTSVDPSSSKAYWSVPSPLAFDNIGFSKTTEASLASPSQLKFLICADCDTGPLGWHDTEGRDLGREVEAENRGLGRPTNAPDDGTAVVRKDRSFFLAADRVRYKID